MSLSRYSTEQLRDEIEKREGPEMCSTCRKWPVKHVYYSAPGIQPHCSGCMKLVKNCTCRTI